MREGVKNFNEYDIVRKSSEFLDVFKEGGAKIK